MFSGALFGVLCLLIGATDGEEVAESGGSEGGVEHYKLVEFNFERVELPYVICLWILIVALAKIAFHLYHKLPTIIPESCLLIVLGLIVGAILHFTHTATTSEYVLDAEVFFIYLLPPIIFDAGYFMPVRSFFDNLGTILLLAFVNTCISAGLIGISLYGISLLGWFGRTISILDCFIFSSLISAVDPVAVLSVFEEVHVNQMLYIIVFGESLLNDGVTVVLFRMMEGFIKIGEKDIITTDIVKGISSFFIIAIGGTLIGVIFGFFGGFITKYTKHVKVIEPLFVFIIGYLMYLTAEMFHFSSILALAFGGIVLRHYLEANVSRSTKTSIKYFMKMLANVSETIIFMFLGLSTIVDTLDWNLSFIFFSLLFCLVFRVLGIAVLSWILNRRRLVKLTFIDQFVMAYGGLRGGIAFCLALSLNEEHVPEKKLFVTATIIIVFFTVFVQGISIKPCVNALKVKKEEENEPSMNEKIHESFIDHLMAGMEGITKRSSHNLMRIKFRDFNHKYLQPLFGREKPKTKAKKVLEVFHTISVADALDQLDNPQVNVSQKESLYKPSDSMNGSSYNGLVNGGFEDSNQAARFIDRLERPVYRLTDDNQDVQTEEQKVVREWLRRSPPEGGGKQDGNDPDNKKSKLVDAPMEEEKKSQSNNHSDIKISFLKRDDDESHIQEDNQKTEDASLSQDEEKGAMEHASDEKDDGENDNKHISILDALNNPMVPQIDISNPLHGCVVLADELPARLSTESYHQPDELPPPPREACELSREHSQDSESSLVSEQSTTTDEGETVDQTVEVPITAVESVLPWKTSYQDNVPLTVSLGCDMNEPVPAQAPSWVHNLEYSHLKESGSPYASPEITLVATKKETHTSIFDLFKTDAFESLLNEKTQKVEEEPSQCYVPVLPPPWSIHSSEDIDQPISSPSICVHGDKDSILLSNHTSTPPSHHVILPTMHFTEGSLSHEHSDDSEMAKPLKSLPGSASAPDLPKHFQVMTKERLYSSSMIEDLEFHHQAISRVQEWLSTHDEDSGIVLPMRVPTPDLLSDNDADVSDNDSFDGSFGNSTQWKVSSDEESSDPEIYPVKAKVFTKSRVKDEL
ncbi:hypothetical protein FSP39_002795 [Pinctada imbricata]|uniref:Sodium/hydrogen exchanger n=1 Tax=Pinctada imbricata TaxID=66713 RepID=A0AA88XHB3_PINIB|nr:hypothetical protein FSP39_002795 [Pinctada imbricata]